MDSSEKTYMWLIIIAFVGFVIATGFAAMELNELKAPIEPGNFNKAIFN